MTLADQALERIVRKNRGIAAEWNYLASARPYSRWQSIDWDGWKNHTAIHTRF